MKKTIDRFDFHRAFADYGRGSQLSPDALDALFKYFEEFEDSTGEEIELGVIGICCDWCEYPNAIEAAKELTDWDNAPIRHVDEDDEDEDEDEDEREQSALEYLRDRTTVIELDDSILVQNF